MSRFERFMNTPWPLMICVALIVIGQTMVLVARIMGSKY